MLSNRLDLTDRVAIEFGLSSGKTFKQIAKELRKSPSTISREVKANREHIRGSFFLNNDCRYALNSRVEYLIQSCGFGIERCGQSLRKIGFSALNGGVGCLDNLCQFAVVFGLCGGLRGVGLDRC